MDALMGARAELERQTIYFAPPEHLNDPIEGVRQFYWRGDRITWRNLLRNYVICLKNRMIEARLTHDSERLNPRSISAFWCLDNQPTPQARSLSEACIEAVEKGELHGALLDLLANSERNISFSELQQHLRTVHTEWLISVHNVFCQHGLAQQTEALSQTPGSLVNSLRTLHSVIPDLHAQYSDDGIEIINNIQNSLVEQMTILSAYQQSEALTPKKEGLLFDFPGEYLCSLVKLVYPSWYVACFSAQHDNAAMWSYYADNHRGCCLVFATHETDAGRTLRLNGPVGYGSHGILRRETDLPLQSVLYSTDEQRMEFFTNIGQLPRDLLIRNWFQDDAGTISPLARHFSNEQEEEWRNGYWERFEPPLLRKLPDWEHEQELRIILSDILNIHDTDEGRLFTYDCNTLDGIIFGINTNLSDKVRILRILDSILANRSTPREFKFYQAKYNSTSGRIEAHHLDLIRHKKN